ncbi:serine-rich adhesin for platelets isoform X3 [Phlebotomus papatasi]|uniref:serine-rich adhesin for platelets isoform X3 n=1 Tax=Phlebotomus papatasi TaxID=29031 RepID=UPI0024844AD5|nr:serine-rich adhesin for platelets isoform X3 [Phlebotomus papatasi]XP_055710404.1 serine-rich adhesin for platelets isoform X3 [Phlebotomus papatasi]
MSTSFQNRMSTLVASTAASALSSSSSPMTASTNDPKANAGIVLQGYYRKLKTMKKKYFVLYSDTKERSARLEYYDSEKKFKTNFGHPKRTIVLRTCFNINRRTDTKHKWVVALYTKDDCFCIVFDNEQDLNTWLRNLLAQQRGDDSTGDPPRPNFEHTWSVQVQRKGLAEDKGIIGNYHLCLTEKSLTLVRVGSATTVTGDHRLGSVEFLLTTIRRCGNTQCFFYMEVGRHSAIGAGELWMETQDPFIAENMHQTIISASASCKNREDYMGPVRPRSSSANEASKPISMTMRRQTHVGQKPMNFSPSGAAVAASTSCHQRALSLPCAAAVLNAAPSSSSVTASASSKVSGIQPVHQRTRSLPLTEETAIVVPMPRPETRVVNCSCPTDGAPNSLCTHRIPHGATPVGIDGVHMNNNHLPPAGCPGGNCPEMNNNRDHQLILHHHLHHHHQMSTTSMESIVEDQALASEASEEKIVKNLAPRKISTGKFPGASASFSGGSPLLIRRARNSNSTRSSAMKRERCDSLPSRNRAISESSQQNNTSMPPPRSIPSNRPHSMYNRHSNSPPVNSCPLSPSGACSESDGSSLSIDETDGFGQSLTPDEYGHHFQRYMGGMSQESAILEENSDDYWNSDKKIHTTYDRSHRFGEKGISQNGTSLSLPITQSQGQRKGSPAPPVGSVEGRSSYIEMYSPCGSSPGDPTGSSGYLPMSPGVDFGRGVYTGSSGVHSRASSLAEEGVDGGSQNDQYVDMDASHRHQGLSGMSSAASSSSITSGTPSTDTRFADYPLEKVFARFTPDEEDNTSADRPIRAYSVGSRIEHNKRKFRIDLLNTDNSSLRARAFSLGSRAKVPRSEQYKGGLHAQSTIVQTNRANNNGSGKGGKKSSSAPMLDKRTNQELMDDFMEIDFSRGDEDTPTSTMPMPVPTSQSSESCNFNNEGFTRTSTDNTDGYVEMKPVAVTKSPSLSSSPVKSYMSPRTVPLRSLAKNNNNVEMSPVMGRGAPSGSVLATSPKTSTTSDDYLNMSPVEGIHEKMDVDMPRMSSAPEGYIEMSWPKNSKTVNNNTIPEKPASDEYINMSFQGARRNTKKEAGTQRMTSMPIAIQQGKQTLYTGRSSLTGKSESQQSFLPLSSGPTTQPPAHRSESKDSGIVTPTGSNAAIFPFSPSSPMKPFQHTEPRKCLIDGTSGTLMLAEEEVSHGSSGVATPTTPVPMDAEESMGKVGVRKCHAEEMLENRYVDSVAQQTKIRRLSMEVPDYVNCTPVGVRKITPSVSPLRNSAEDVAGDYVLMRPATTVERIPKKTPLSNNSSQISLNNFEGFIPIAQAEEEASREDKVVSPRSANPSSLKRPFWYGKESDASFDSLRVASRPNSVNSDKITSKISSLSLNRPNSANSDHVPPISSSSSASTLCGSSSSSSTLCGSKSPSSATLMRPQSFTESTSRPDSVTDATSRPPSVTSERELHYASLDLPPCSANAGSQVAPLARQEATELSSSSASSKNNSLSGDSSASPSPNAAPAGATQVPAVAFNYAQIDFTKCENAKATTPN